MTSDSSKRSFTARLAAKRARRYGDTHTFTELEWKNVKRLANGICLCCKRTHVKLTVDHVIPLSKGGRNVIENIQPLCSECNIKKDDRIVDYRVTNSYVKPSS